MRLELSSPWPADVPRVRDEIANDEESRKAKQEKEIKIMSKTNINNVRVPLLVTLIGAAALSAMLPPGLRADPPVIGDDQMQALTTTVGGAQVLQTTRTVIHWFGSTLDPNNGVSLRL